VKWIAIGLLTAATLATASACSHKRTDDGTTPASGKALPPLTVKDDSPDLMLTWIDDKGAAHVELRPADVPAAGRALVRVVVSDRDEGTRELFYVADLTQKDDAGAYATRTMRRRDWESELEKRRDAYLARTAPPPRTASSAGSGDPQATAQERGAPTVIIYGASWCGPCHEAADFLKAKGIAYVLKDIEATPGAAAEMREKLSRAGQHGGSIPVIDVRGQILVGYSASALDRALARAAAGTVL
jgi:glutaredoxin